MHNYENSDGLGTALQWVLSEWLQFTGAQPR